MGKQTKYSIDIYGECTCISHTKNRLNYHTKLWMMLNKGSLSKSFLIRYGMVVICTKAFSILKYLKNDLDLVLQFNNYNNKLFTFNSCSQNRKQNQSIVQKYNKNQ